MASYSGVLAGAAFIRLTLNDAKLAEGLEKAQKNVQTFSQRAKAAFMSMEVLGDKAFGGFLTVAFPIATAVREFARFNDTIRTFKAISGASNQQMGAMENQIRNLGKTTAFTAKQVADGAVELSRMGLDVNEVGSALPAALNLVRATGEETFRLGEVSEFAAASLRIFNLDATKFEDVTDVMAYAANESAMGVADLGEAMKIAGPSAHSIGENIRDAAAALMLFANAGIKGSLAGTSLRKIYQSLAAVSGQTEGWSAEELEMGMRGKDQLLEMGIKVVDENGNLRKAQDIMVDLANAVKRMKSGEKINFATDVFDLRGSLGALSMLSNPKDLIRFRNELNNVGGYARKTAEDIEKGPGGQLRQLLASIQDLGLSFGDFMANNLKPFIEGIKDLSSGLSPLLGQLGGFGKFLVQTSAGAMGAGVALWGITKALSAIGSGFAPLYAGIKWLDSYASGARKAATEAEKLANASVVAMQNQATIAKASKGLESAQNKFNSAKTDKARETATVRLAEAKKRYAAANALATTSEGVLTAAKVHSTRAAQKKLTVMLAANKNSLLAAACNAKNAASLWAMSVAEIAAAKGGTAYAIATKAAAGATLAFNAALKFIAANPVLVAFTVLSIAISAVTSAIQKQKEKFQELINKAREASDEARNAFERGNTERDVAQNYFKRAEQLAEISKTASLTAEQIEDAVFIINKIEPFAGKGWATIDKTTGKLKIAANALSAFQKGLVSSKETDIANMLKAKQNEIDKYLYQEKTVYKSGNNANSHGAAYDWTAFDETETIKVKRQLTEEEKKKVAELEREKKVLSEILQKEKILKAVENYKPGVKMLSEKERTKILEDIAKLEDDIARKKRSAFENEIHDIKQVRAEYEKNIQKLIENAKTQEEIAKLEKQKKTALADYDNQIKEAQKKEQERIEKTWSDRKNYVRDMESRNAFDEKRRVQDEGFDKLLSGNKFAEAIQAITAALNAEKNIYASLKADYAKNLSDFKLATSSGGAEYSESENKILDANQSALQAAFARQNDLQRKLRDAYAAAEDVRQRDNMRAIGGYSAALLSRALGTDGDAAERTATAAQKTVDLLKAIKQNTATAKDYEQVFN